MLKQELTQQMIDYFDGDVPRVNHALKVLGFALAIAGIEGLDSRQLEIVEIAAILHDIGIVNAEKKYHSTAGNYQEIEGPPVARQMLEKHELPEETIERICFLIGHHHSYTKIDGIDFQILVEADFLVNIFEDKMSDVAIKSMRDKYFKTKTGFSFLDKLFM
ncbi:MAG: HD domain-containing protein [Prolixibacteraceae bacterium]|nr:HD domain-containing protein [Prolixibacteraceae bacterium]MBN2650220.1 HD domain-containing protein [Prolixibacteraceae bacterium]